MGHGAAGPARVCSPGCAGTCLCVWVCVGRGRAPGTGRGGSGRHGNTSPVTVPSRSVGQLWLEDHRAETTQPACSRKLPAHIPVQGAAPGSSHRRTRPSWWRSQDAGTVFLISISHVRRHRHREGRRLTPGHTAWSRLVRSVPLSARPRQPPPIGTT